MHNLYSGTAAPINNNLKLFKFADFWRLVTKGGAPRFGHFSVASVLPVCKFFHGYITVYQYALTSSPDKKTNGIKAASKPSNFCKVLPYYVGSYTSKGKIGSLIDN